MSVIHYDAAEAARDAIDRLSDERDAFKAARDIAHKHEKAESAECMRLIDMVTERDREIAELRSVILALQAERS